VAEKAWIRIICRVSLQLHDTEISLQQRALRVTQTTMGRRVEALHARAGVRFLQKTPTSFVLTQAGERVLEAAERIEVEALLVERAIKGDNERIAGRSGSRRLTRSALR
jgi:DNA-binding transcriptional LysR family regulator